VSRLAGLHFAPTEANRLNLLDEGIAPERIVVTGNTVIDALLFAVGKVRQGAAPMAPLLRRELDSLDGSRLVLVTAHRRESFGAGIRSICEAIRALAAEHEGTRFIYPVHPNPNICGVVREALGDVPNVRLMGPLDYLSFVALLDRADIVLTDSGGLQEEAPSLGKPVVVMRDTTERGEGIEAGTACLVGTDRDRICGAVTALLTDAEEYARMARAANPYGDGKAGRRIVAALEGEV
jgi:UDP-N-acetylglucosamine 2-epimerase (non-hydrolysing)